MWINILITWIVVINTNAITLILSSNNNNQTIRQTKMFSCYRANMAIYNDNLVVYITQIPTSISNVTVYFQFLQKTVQICPNPQTNSVSFNFTTQNYSNTSQTTEIIKIQLNESQQMQYKVYMLKCEQNQQWYSISLPIIAIIVTQIIALLLTLILPRNITYRRVKPLSFQIPFALFYAAFLFVGVYLQTYFHSKSDIPWQRIIIIIFATVCVFMYTQDLLSFIFANRYFCVDILSASLTLLLIGSDNFLLEDAFFLNDIIAFMIAGALIKFVVIRKLKASMIPLIILWIFFVLRQFALNFKLQNYQQSLQLQVIPLFLQLPAFTDQGYSCSAFGTSKIISYGLILHYSIRIDLFLSTRFYQALVIVVTVICFGVELGIVFLFDEIPISSFTGVLIFVPITISLLMFFASKRGEWAQIWHGSFYDMAVNRKSIQRGLDSQIQNISSSIQQGLRANIPSLLSD